MHHAKGGLHTGSGERQFLSILIDSNRVLSGHARFQDGATRQVDTKMPVLEVWYD